MRFGKPAGERMPARRIGPAVLTVAFLLALAAAAGPALAARQPQPPVATQEWQRLVHLWQAMLDHSSDVVSSVALCRELAKDVDTADADLTALAQRGALSKSVAESLRTLVHMRYRYLTECHYTRRAVIRVSAAEASVTAAQWVVEMQLAILRRPPVSEAEEGLAAAAESNLTSQLTFLYHAFAFEEEADRRRLKLREREKAGEKVDWEAFDTECQKRRNRLLEAHGRRDLSRVRAVGEVIPYVVSLTRQEPPSQSAAGASARPGS